MGQGDENLENVFGYFVHIQGGLGLEASLIADGVFATSDFDFAGLIDEVWVFNETLPTTAITNLFLHNDYATAPVVSVLTYRFEAQYTQIVGGAPETREIIVARQLTDQELADTRVIRVEGLQNALERRR